MFPHFWWWKSCKDKSLSFECGHFVQAQLELGESHYEGSRYILTTWLFFFPLLWTCAQWQGTTAPLLLQLAWDKWKRKSETGAAKEATELYPKSQRATYLSAPLWVSHILACTCLWQSRGLPPTTNSPQTSILRSQGERPGDPHSSRMIDRAAARRKGSCDETEKERSVYPCPLCAFNYLPSCLLWPCPHNRVLTGAVSRQH